MIIFPNQLFKNKKGGISFPIIQGGVISPISIIQVSNGGNSFSVFANNFTQATQAGSTLIAAFLYLAPTGMSVSAVTDGLNTYTLIPGSICSGISPNAGFPQMIGAQIAYCTNALSVPSGLSTTGIMGNGLSPTYSFMNLLEVTRSTLDHSTTGTANQVFGNSISAGTITTTNNGSLGIATIFVDDGLGAGSIGSPGSGWTFLLNGGGGAYEFGAEYALQASAGIISGNIVTTNKTQSYFGSMATFKPM